MAFDISTAKPIEQKGSFDISSASAVQEPEQTQQIGPQSARIPGRSARGDKLRQERELELESFLSSLPPERRKLIESVSPLEALAISIGRGLSDIGAGVGLKDPEDKFTRERMAELERAQPVMKIGRPIGQAAPFLPLGVAAAGIPSTAARVAATAALGGSEGAIIAKGMGGDLGQQLLSAGIGSTVAGALELGIPVAGRVGGRIVRRALGRRPKGSVIDNSGNPSDELIQSMEKLGLDENDLVAETVKELTKNDVIDPEQAARAAFFRSQDIQPTKAQITQLADDFQAQQEAFKTSTRVREALEAQDAILTTRFDNKIIDETIDTNIPAANVADTLIEKASELDNEISRLYNLARDRSPEGDIVRFDSLTKTVSNLSPLDKRAKGNVSAIKGLMDRKGYTVPKKAKSGIDQITLKSKPIEKRVTVNQAENLRKEINKLYDETLPGGDAANNVLRIMKDSLDDDVFRASGDDIFKEGRKAKTEFERGLERAKVSKFDKRGKNLVRDVLENKITTDEFTKKVVMSRAWRDTDIKQLIDYISDAPNGEAAINDLKRDVLQEIRENVFTAGKLQGGDGLRGLSRAKLDNYLNKKIGEKKLNVIFNNEEVKFLKDMLRVAELREPVAETFKGLGPSAQAIKRLEAKFSALPIMRDLIDLFDPSGREAMKAFPRPKGQDLTPSQARTILSISGGGATAGALADDE